MAIRSPDRGFRDDITGVVTRYLFVNHGRRLSAAYLFDHPLQIACRQAGLVDSTGRTTVTAHRFRHTVGTQLVAGPSAEILRSGGLSAEAVDWLKTNFFKTELELGYCLRLPQEGRVSATST